MLPAAIISFRETLEMFIIVFSLITFICKTEMKQLMKYIYIGIGCGLLSGLFIGSIVFISTKSLTGASGDIFEGGMLIFTAIIMAIGIILMSKQTISKLNDPIENRYNLKYSAVSIFSITFLTVFRETLEVCVYTLPLLKENLLSTIVADTLGLLTSFSLLILLYKATIKIDMSLILKLLTFFLIYVGANMLGDGLEKLLPQINDISTAGILLYGIPLFFIFLKNQIKSYLRKQ